MSKEALSARIKRMLKKHGLSGVNKAKRTPNHPTKSHIVLAKEGDKLKLIRFGEQGAKTNQNAKQRKGALRIGTERTSLAVR